MVAVNNQIIWLINFQLTKKNVYLQKKTKSAYNLNKILFVTGYLF